MARNHSVRPVTASFLLPLLTPPYHAAYAERPIFVGTPGIYLPAQACHFDPANAAIRNIYAPIGNDYL